MSEMTVAGGTEMAGAAEREIEREIDEHGATFRRFLEEKTISLGTMSRRLRLLTGVAVAQLIVAGVFLALRNAHLSMTVAENISSRNAGVVSVPTVVLWISVELLSLGWAYLLAGAFDSALPLRLAGLLIYSGDIALLWLNSGFRGVYGAAEASLLGIVWATGAWTWRTQRRGLVSGVGPESSRRSPGMVTGLVLAAATGLIYVLDWFGPSSNGPSSEAFSSAVFEQLGIMALVLVPALLLAGSEFAEWGEVLGEGLGRVSASFRRHRTAVATSLVVLVAAAVLAHVIAASSSGLAVQLALGAGLAGILAVSGWLVHRRPKSTSVPRLFPYVAVVLCAVGFYVITSGDLLIRTSSAILPSARQMALGGNLIGYGQTSQPAFGIEYPSGWTVERTPPNYTVFDGTSFGESMIVFEVAVPAAQFQQALGFAPSGAIQALVQDMFQKVSNPPPQLAMSGFARTGSWTYQFFELLPPGSSKAKIEGIGLERVVAGRVWVLLGSARTGFGFDKAKGQLFAAMAKSWTPNPATYRNSLVLAGAGTGTTYPVWALGFWSIVALAGLVILTLRSSTMRPSRVAGVLLVETVALFFVATGGAVRAGASGFHFLQFGGIQAIVAIGSLVYVATQLVRRSTGGEFARRVSLLLMLNAGLQIVAWLYQLFGGAVAAGGQFSLVQALVVLAALVWELLFSGVTMTNADSRAFPRHARVLVFCGYILLVATTVLFFSSLHVQSTGSRLEPVFESEAWVQRGMLGLAVPMLVTMFMLRWRGPSRKSESVEPSGAEAEVQPAVTGEQLAMEP